jgi:hypothetical protein
VRERREEGDGEKEKQGGRVGGDVVMRMPIMAS